MKCNKVGVGKAGEGVRPGAARVPEGCFNGPGIVRVEGGIVRVGPGEGGGDILGHEGGVGRVHPDVGVGGGAVAVVAVVMAMAIVLVLVVIVVTAVAGVVMPFPLEKVNSGGAVHGGGGGLPEGTA